MIEPHVSVAQSWRGPWGLKAKHLALLLGVVVLAVVALVVWQTQRVAVTKWEPGNMPISQAMEDKYGVRFSFVAVTAGGGMVELRYRVVDAGKAANFGHYTETAPMLISEVTGKVVDVTIMGLHNHRVEPGRTYYVLYRNTGNAIVSHEPLTIVVGDLKLEHVVAW